MPLSARQRAARGVGGALLATFVALGSHVLAGGAVPTVEGIAVPLALSVAVCVQLAGRARSLWRLTLAVGISQWLFHQLFMIGGPGLEVTQAPGHGHHGGAATVTVTDAVDTAVHAGHSSAAMTAAHIAAAVLTILAMHRAESVWLALDRAAVAWLRRRTMRRPRPVIVAPAVAAPVDRTPIVVPSAPCRGPSPLRGPPVAVA